MTKRKEVRVEFKMRNNLILSRMEEMGIRTVSGLVQKMPTTSPNQIYQLIAMKLPGRKRDGSWHKTALSLSEFFGCLPEDLFSDEQQQRALETNRATAEISFGEISQLISHQFRPDQLAEAAELKRFIHQKLFTLTPRENRVLALRFGFYGQDEQTLEQIAESFGVTREVIRQIEAKALRKLKHPSRSGVLRAAAGHVHKNGGDPSEVFDTDSLTAMHHV